MLLYVILSGCSPFSADEEDEILKLVAAAQYVFHEGEFASVSANAKDMIAKLLVADPSPAPYDAADAQPPMAY